jgi:hypothetical protein
MTKLKMTMVLASLFSVALVAPAFAEEIDLGTFMTDEPTTVVTVVRAGQPPNGSAGLLVTNRSAPPPTRLFRRAAAASSPGRADTPLMLGVRF